MTKMEFLEGLRKALGNDLGQTGSALSIHYIL